LVTVAAPKFDMGLKNGDARWRLPNTCITLATTKKCTSTIAEFSSNMKGYADEMTSSSKALGNDKLAAYVLTSLDEEIYNAFVTSIVTRVEPISASKLYS
jgi:hypothetical protein